MARDLIHYPAIQFCTITLFFFMFKCQPSSSLLPAWILSCHKHTLLIPPEDLSRAWMRGLFHWCRSQDKSESTWNIFLFFSLTTLFKATLCKKWYFLWFCGPTVHVHVHMHLIVITLLMGWHGGAVVSSWNWFPFGGLPPSTSSSSLPWCVPYYYESPPLFLATSNTFHNAGSHLIHLSCKYID